MITHLRRVFGPAPARGRISVPAALLILGVALSCSTACLTSAVIQTSQPNQYDENIAAAQRQLEQNIRTRLGGEVAPAVSDEPASIERALRLALPVRQYGRPGADPDAVEVTASLDARGQKLYLITVTGDFSDFNFFYDSAFVKYANSLRMRIAVHPAFHIKEIRAVNGKSYTVREQELR